MNPIQIQLIPVLKRFKPKVVLSGLNHNDKNKNVLNKCIINNLYSMNKFFLIS